MVADCWYSTTVYVDTLQPYAAVCVNALMVDYSTAMHWCWQLSALTVAIGRVQSCISVLMMAAVCVDAVQPCATCMLFGTYKPARQCLYNAIAICYYCILAANCWVNVWNDYNAWCSNCPCSAQSIAITFVYAFSKWLTRVNTLKFQFS